MSRLIFFFLVIIFFIIFLNIASAVPTTGEKLIPKNAVEVYQPQTMAKIEDDDEEYEDEELNDIIYDDPIDTKKPLVIMGKSHSIRTIPNNIIFIGFVFSVIRSI